MEHVAVPGDGVTDNKLVFHSMDVEAAAAALDTDRDNGLSGPEAESRLATHGPNAIAVSDGQGALALAVEQVKDPLVVLLVVAAAISAFALDELTDAAVILAIVVLNAALGFFQQYRAEQALSRLRELAAPSASAVRSGQPTQLSAAQLVPGDVIRVHAGDRVPADARIAEAHHLSTAEAILTGEAFPEPKSARAVAADAPLADRASMLHMGTTVVTGRGTAIVTSTGRATAMGEIADLLAEKRPPTPLQRELARLGRVLGAAALVIVAALFLVGWLEGYAPQEMFLTAVALAVAAVPEGLPAVVTITLARGVQRLAAQSAIIRRLQAVETLGAATVVCTDKTGTLTRNRIVVHQVVLDGVTAAPANLDAGDMRVRMYAEVAALCNDADPGVALADPMESALLTSLATMGFDIGRMRAEKPRVDEVAFDSRRKLMSTLHESDGEWFVAVKGAAEVVLHLCTHVQGESSVSALVPEALDRFHVAARSLSAAAFRTLALAYRVVDSQPHTLSAAERDLVLVGLVALSDEVRPESARAVSEAREAGVRVVMITGDHPDTAATVARDLGILDEGQEVLPGDQLSGMTAEQLREQVDRYGAYARVDPADKVKIVRAWQERGEVVAMTGDGVNDAPALRSADIGVAMGSGSDVSRDAAAIVLADDNFATLVGAIREGRGIFENLQKVIRFLLTTNASELLVMGAGFLVFGQLGEPLLATQILWVNLVTDGLPVLVLAADSPSHDVMRRPPVRERSLVSARAGAGLLWRAAILACAPVAGVLYGHYLEGASWSRVQTIVFTALVLIQLGYAFVVRAEGRGASLRGIVPLLVATGVSLGLQLVVVYTSWGQQLLSVEPLQPLDWAAIVAFAAVAIGAVLLVARLSRGAGRGFPGATRRPG